MNQCDLKYANPSCLKQNLTKSSIETWLRSRGSPAVSKEDTNETKYCVSSGLFKIRSTAFPFLGIIKGSPSRIPSVVMSLFSLARAQKRRLVLEALLSLDLLLDLLLYFVRLLLLLLLLYLGHDHLAENGALHGTAQLALAGLSGCSGSIGRRRVVGEISILGVVFAHLERFDAVTQLDNLNTPTKPCFGNVGPELGQQVVVRGALSLEPWVI